MPISDQGFGDLASAVGSIFGAVGQQASAKGYSQAAGYAQQNAELAQESTNIQQLQAERKIYQTLGGQRADIAGAGLMTSGSALDVIRSSAEQGSLTKQLIAKQGAINVLGYEAEAANYSAMASAAKASASGGFLGGILKAAGAVASFAALSDDRMKEHVTTVATRRDGLRIVEFNYRGSSQRFKGVMASDVERLYPKAISWQDGLRFVDYDMIGVIPEVVGA